MGLHGQFRKAFHLAMKPLLPRHGGDGLVVLGRRRLQRAAQLLQALRHGGHLVVQRARHVAQGSGLIVAARDHPQVGHRAQDGHERGMRHQNDVMPIAMVEQIAAQPHGLDVRGLDGHEHEHEPRALHADQIAVVLPRKFIHMPAHGLHMRAQGRHALLFRPRGDGPVVIHERDLAVDHQMLAVGQMHHEIRLERRPASSLKAACAW
ncbi:hypothetical protein CDEF62S_01950 [Castellaniella defragrans]